MSKGLKVGLAVITGIALCSALYESADYLLRIKHGSDYDDDDFDSYLEDEDWDDDYYED